MSYVINLSGRTALITGASSGFGEHFARVLSDAGASVVLAARRKDRIDDLAAQIAEGGGDAMAVEMDVTQPGSVADGFAMASQAQGTPDIIVNNAGVANPASFLDLSEDDWDFVMGTNFKGVRLVAREGARRLVEAGKPGSIINIASVLALGGQPLQSAYAASKGAVVQLTKVLALELFRYNIRVNALCPGYFNTEMNEEFFGSEAGKAYIARTPGHRLGELSELTLPLLMFASAEAGFSTGSSLTVDGGHTARIV
jgi:NAD(P)-dependent dehydrogenase (short-subunit alcohol dehydrogenase family)